LQSAGETADMLGIAHSFHQATRYALRERVASLDGAWLADNFFNLSE